MATFSPPSPPSSPPISSGETRSSAAASKTFLIVAVVLGVLATVLAFGFISSAAEGDRGPKIRIVVAKRDLAVNATIDPDRDLAVDEVPAKYSSLTTVTLDAASLSTYKGEKLNRSILAKQPVFTADLSAYGEFRIADPYRALTIAAEPGIVIPGDYVKVLMSRPDTAGAAQVGVNPSIAPYTATYVSNGQAFRVIAVGGRLKMNRSQILGSESSSTGGAKNVTLEVTEAQARDIIAALGNGAQRATLIICPPPEAATRP